MFRFFRSFGYVIGIFLLACVALAVTIGVIMGGLWLVMQGHIWLTSWAGARIADFVLVIMGASFMLCLCVFGFFADGLP